MDWILKFCDADKDTWGPFIPGRLDFTPCFRETVFDVITPILFISISLFFLLLARVRRHRIFEPVPGIAELPSELSFTATAYVNRALAQLVLILLQLCTWAFLFAWRLPAGILGYDRDQGDNPPEWPALYMIVDPTLAVLVWIYALSLIFKTFSKPVSLSSPSTPLRTSLYTPHLLSFYSVVFLTALIRLRSQIFVAGSTDGKSLDSRVELVLSVINFVVCFMLWAISVTTPAEVEQEEIIETKDVRVTEVNWKIYRNGRELSLEATASPLSWFTFAWINPLVWEGYLHPLDSEDLWDLTRYHRAKECHVEFLSTQREPSLTRRIYRANVAPIWSQFCTAILSVFFAYSSPFFLNQFLIFIQNPTGRSIEVGYLYVIGMFVGSILNTLVVSQTLYYGRRWNVRMTAMLNSEIYAKTLRRKDMAGAISSEQGSSSSAIGADPGKITNLMSVDTDRLAELSSFVHVFYQCPLEIAIGVAFLYKILGVSSLFGLLVMLVTLPLNHLVGTRYNVVQERLMAARDQRVGMMNELLQGIRMIKLFAWERSLEHRVMEARRLELRRFLGVYVLNASFGLLWFASPILVTIVSFLWYTKMAHNELNAATAFTSIVLFGMLKEPLNVIPEVFMAIVEARVSLRRVEAFLGEDETPKFDRKRKKNSRRTAAWGVGADNAEEIVVGFRNAEFKWHLGRMNDLDIGDNVALPIDATVATDGSDLGSRFDDSFVAESTSSSIMHGFNSHNYKQVFRLRNLNLNFPVGELSIICGPTGSGKTSLLMALLGEMDLVGGHVYLPSRDPSDHRATVNDHGLYAHGVAYVAQQPWLQQTSIRENILFGQPYDEERYEAVLNACALAKDLSILEDGDQTEIGEKGITLSGGQKQRVSLARAVYSHAATVLLDDCLSAVDGHIAKHLVEKCIAGPLMQGRTRILVTHHVRLCLRSADYVAKMEGGKVTVKGRVEALRNQGLLVQVLNEEAIELDEQGAQKAVATATTGDVLDVHEQAVTEVEEEEVLEEVRMEGIIRPKDTPAAKAARRLIEEEQRQTGRVKLKIYGMYLAACGGWFFWILLLTLYVLVRVANVAEGWWIKVWTAAYGDTKFFNSNISTSLVFAEQQPDISSLFFPLRSPFDSIMPVVPASQGQQLTLFRTWVYTTGKPVPVDYYIGVYCLIELAAILINVSRTAVQYWGSLKASKTLYHRLLVAVLHAPMRFFDTTPVGRIMNRFSKDIETIDSQLSWNAGFLLQTILGVISVVVVITAITPEFIFASIFIGFIYLIIGALYIRASRELKRINSVTRSPVFSQFTETLNGVSTIRAYGVEDRFMKEILVRLDNNIRPFYLLWMCNRWLLVRVECSGALVTFFAGIFLLWNLKRNDTGLGIDAGLAGLSLSFARSFLDHVYWLVRQYTTVEMHLNSVERVQEYIEMPQEPPAILRRRPPAAWPTSATIEVKDLVIRYAYDLEPVIRDITFSIRTHEKVGIVGRASSGKSTLALSFFRYVDPSKGYIKIDGINITQIGVEDLRSKLTIISQDAFLFTGTVRSNLDPFDEYEEDDILESLRRVHLVESINLPDETGTASSGGGDGIISLDTPVSEGGNNFSQGQKQLLCLARALLRNSKLIIMDEATASVDLDTEKKIQTSIREEFVDSTLLCVAHRLRTIIDYDRVMVLDHGRIVEFDTPHNLLQQESGLFRSMCVKSGELEVLEDMAARVDQAKTNRGERGQEVRNREDWREVADGGSAW